ncbi:YcxB family protein [Streptomyces sp. NPDC002992]|uniref:YcxB family protein n=1 Tax=Streptomyces sp. NPDC002992 TaxID=3154273 RepID=UPI0033A0B7A6
MTPGGQMRESVELVYVPTRADVADAVRVQMRYGMFRRLRWLLPAVAVLAVLVIALELFGPGEPDSGRVALMAGLGTLVAVIGPLTPRLAARQMFAMIERQGEFRARVDEQGVGWTTSDTETVTRWPMLPRYVETPTQFVLLSADKARAGAAALPKRGLADPVDVDRLRDLLDRSITRL